MATPMSYPSYSKALQATTHERIEGAAKPGLVADGQITKPFNLPSELISVVLENGLETELFKLVSGPYKEPETHKYKHIFDMGYTIKSGVGIRSTLKVPAADVLTLPHYASYYVSALKFASLSYDCAREVSKVLERHLAVVEQDLKLNIHQYRMFSSRANKLLAKHYYVVYDPFHPPPAEYVEAMEESCEAIAHWEPLMKCASASRFVLKLCMTKVERILDGKAAEKSAGVWKYKATAYSLRAGKKA